MAEPRKSKPTAATAVAVPAKSAALSVPDLNEVAAILAESLNPGEQLDVFALPTIKLPAGGGLAWTLPDGEIAKELSGVIIDRHVVRAYWDVSFDESGGGGPPDCSSLDNLTGQGDPGGDCVKCPFNEWGSGKDNAKACRQITRLYLLRDGDLLPTLVPLPPSSFQASQKYVVSLAAGGKSYYGLRTRIGLAQTKSGGGITYSLPVFAQGASLEPAEQAAVAHYRRSIMPVLRATPVTSGEASEAVA